MDCEKGPQVKEDWKIYNLSTGTKRVHIDVSGLDDGIDLWPLENCLGVHYFMSVKYI